MKLSSMLATIYPDVEAHTSYFSNTSWPRAGVKVKLNLC